MPLRTLFRALCLTALLASPSRAQSGAPFRAGDAVEIDRFSTGAWTRGRIVEVIGVYGGCANYRVATAGSTDTKACTHVRAVQGSARGADAARVDRPTAPAAAQRPALRTYRCAAMVNEGGQSVTRARAEMTLASPTTYRVGSRTYRYEWVAARGVIRWRSGPFASPYPESRADAAWIGIARAGERWDCR